MKKYIYIGVAALIAILCVVSGIQANSIKKYKQEVSELTTSLRAYSEENSKLNGKNREFALTIDQLNYTNDSLFVKMNDMRKQLGYKDKQIKELSYIASTAHRVDTLTFRDTLFVETMTPIDTTIRDKDDWYRCNVGLRYPSTISIEPTFKSEKYVITSVVRETVNPPKKCWIGRLFQRKHDVVIVDVVENNPFITNNKERFLTIVK